MNKFIITSIPEYSDEKPVLYNIYIGSKGAYYLHKGKKLKESVDRFLDDVYRGMRNKSCPEYYSKVVDYCNKFPAIHQVSVEVVYNGEPAKLLKKEDALYKTMKRDDLSLNRLDIAPYKPEWMLKDAFQKRCENCLKIGLIDGVRIAFKFCPLCGRLIK